MKTSPAKSLFTRFASFTACTAGKPATFLGAVLVILIWAVTGPLFHFSDTWQLVINTGTTIVTFLMVFLIQNTQNRDSQALQVKLDELILVTHGAHHNLLDLEDLSDADLERIRAHYAGLASRAHELAHRPKRHRATSRPAKKIVASGGPVAQPWRSFSKTPCTTSPAPSCSAHSR